MPRILIEARAVGISSEARAAVSPSPDDSSEAQKHRHKNYPSLNTPNLPQTPRKHFANAPQANAPPITCRGVSHTPRKHTPQNLVISFHYSNLSKTCRGVSHTPRKHTPQNTTHHPTCRVQRGVCNTPLRFFRSRPAKGGFFCAIHG